MANENKTPVNANGTIIGRSDTEPLSFHGVTAIARAQIQTLSTFLSGTLTGTVTGTIHDTAASACAGGATPTAANVDSAIAPLVTSTNLALKEIMTQQASIQTRLNDLVTALQNKGVIKA